MRLFNRSAAHSNCGERQLRVSTIAAFAAIGLGAWAQAGAQVTGRVDASNFGIATEDAVISSGLPDVNLDIRSFNESTPQQLMDTASPDYPDLASGASAQEYMVFKFDFSSLPQGTLATSAGSFDFSAWFTREEGMPEESIFGRFKLYEIISGNSGWTDRYVDDEHENPIAVTWTSLNGAFVELIDVTEDITDPPNNLSGNPFGALYPGMLVSNGGFDGANRVVNIPSETLNRLISGQSIGLAMGSVLPLTPLDGDYDRDNDVDGQDFLVWQRQLGAGVEVGTGADGHPDGVVDGEDLQIWSANFGATPAIPTEGMTNFSIHTTESFFSPESAPTLNFDWSAPAAQVVNVPESKSVGLGMLAFLLMLARPAEN